MDQRNPPAVDASRGATFTITLFNNSLSVSKQGLHLRLVAKGNRDAAR